MAVSRHGRAVLDCLIENSGRHLTADEISGILKDNGKTVSTATIYRQLDKLTASGDIRRYTSSPDEPACYQFHDSHGGCTQHFHLKCTVCNRLIHVSCDYLNEIEEHVLEHHGFKIDNTRTVLYGICEKCSAESEGK